MITNLFYLIFRLPLHDAIGSLKIYKWNSDGSRQNGTLNKQRRLSAQMSASRRCSIIAPTRVTQFSG
nr:hypothetical protein [uncultured Kingella sp.]